MKFTALEMATLRDVCLRYPDDRSALDAQLATAVVRSRENTGVGFYTYFDVARASTVPLKGQRMRSGGWVPIRGLNNGMGLILWLVDGYAHCLEGYTAGDATVGLDLTTLEFTLPFDPDPT